MSETLNDFLKGRFCARIAGDDTFKVYTVAAVLGEDVEDNQTRLIVLIDDEDDIAIELIDLTEATFFKTRDACQAFCDDINSDSNREAA